LSNFSSSGCNRFVNYQDKVIDLLTPVCDENPIIKYPAGCEIKPAKTKPYLGLAENYWKLD
jgi:hypothetical protein